MQGGGEVCPMTDLQMASALNAGLMAAGLICT